MSDRTDEPAVSPLPPLGDAPKLSSSRSTNRPSRASSTHAPESPVGLILAGFFVGAVLGGFLILAGAASELGLLVFLGYLLVFAGSVLTAVGVIAAGVRLGMQWARIDSGE